MDQGPLDDRHDYDGAAADHSKPICNVLLGGMSVFIFVGAQAQPIGNTGVGLEAEHNPVEPWIATERLDSYAPGDAHLVLQDLRRMVANCPTVDDRSVTTLAVKPGPSLGDESLEVAVVAAPIGARPTSDSDAVLIRSGDNLIIIEEYGMPSGAPTPMDAVAAAAYRVFTAGQ